MLCNTKKFRSQQQASEISHSTILECWTFGVNLHWSHAALLLLGSLQSLHFIDIPLMLVCIGLVLHYCSLKSLKYF
jgi:hypothetical protein